MVSRSFALLQLLVSPLGALRLPPLSRRAAVLGSVASQAGLLLPTSRAAAAEGAPTLRSIMDATRNMPDGARYPTALIARASYGLETPDVAYPSWAYGRWKVSSTLTSVQAPLGPELFAPRRNGTASLLQARTEYSTRRVGAAKRTASSWSIDRSAWSQSPAPRWAPKLWRAPSAPQKHRVRTLHARCPTTP